MMKKKPKSKLLHRPEKKSQKGVYLQHKKSQKGVESYL